MAIRFLKLNQCGIVKCNAKYAYGASGRNGVLSRARSSQRDYTGVVPKDMNVIYKVKIKSIIAQNDPKTKSTQFQIQLFQQMKSIGNHYYSNDWTEPGGGLGKTKAIKLYNTVAKDGATLLKDLEHGSKERRQVFFITVDALNNIAAVYLRLKEYRKAKDAATQAVELDPYNLKALCRAAKASLMVGEFEECKVALEVAEEIVDNEDTCQGYSKRDVQKLKRELMAKKREYKKLEKEIYAQMLSKNDGGKKGKKKKLVEGKSNQLNQGTIAGKAKMTKSEQRSDERQKDKRNLQLFFIYGFAPIVAVAIWIWVQNRNK